MVRAGVIGYGWPGSGGSYYVREALRDLARGRCQELGNLNCDLSDSGIGMILVGRVRFRWGLRESGFSG